VEQKENMRGGEGTVTIKRWAADSALPPHVRLSATLVLPPGASIGPHVHEGEAELFNVMSGIGEYNDNGTVVPVKPGYVMINYDGQKHGIKNTGGEDLLVTAVIINN